MWHWMFLVAAVWVTTEADNKHVTCPPGMQEYPEDVPDVCFKYVDLELSQPEAQAHCERLATGGTLIEIRDKDRHAVSAQLTDNQIWIGLVYEDEAWRWQSGLLLAVTSNYWAVRQPRNPHNQIRYCVNTWKHNRAEWANQMCTTKRNFICESEQVNGCTPGPCMHGGGCADTVGGYMCTCNAGFTGQNCETPASQILGKSGHGGVIGVLDDCDCSKGSPLADCTPVSLGTCDMPKGRGKHVITYDCNGDMKQCQHPCRIGVPGPFICDIIATIATCELLGRSTCDADCGIGVYNSLWLCHHDYKYYECPDLCACKTCSGPGGGPVVCPGLTSALDYMPPVISAEICKAPPCTNGWYKKPDPPNACNVKKP